MSFETKKLFPLGSVINTNGHLSIAGCDTTELVKQFGTPLYVYDEGTIRHMAREFLNTFRERYTPTRVAYASKAFLNLAMAQIAAEEGLCLDVVSGGEVAVATKAGFPTENMYFHGNNKSAHELSDAIDLGVGTIVVDGFNELDHLNTIASGKGKVQGIMLRLSPSVDAHTHGYTTTGILDVKFGFSIETGDSTVAIRQALSAKNLDLNLYLV